MDPRMPFRTSLSTRAHMVLNHVGPWCFIWPNDRLHRGRQLCAQLSRGRQHIGQRGFGF